MACVRPLSSTSHLDVARPWCPIDGLTEPFAEEELSRAALQAGWHALD